MKKTLFIVLIIANAIFANCPGFPPKASCIADSIANQEFIRKIDSIANVVGANQVVSTNSSNHFVSLGYIPTSPAHAWDTTTNYPGIPNENKLPCFIPGGGGTVFGASCDLTDQSGTPISTKHYSDSLHSLINGVDSAFVKQQVELGLDTFSLNSDQAGALFDTTTEFEGIPNEKRIPCFIPGGGGTPFGANCDLTDQSGTPIATKNYVDSSSGSSSDSGISTTSSGFGGTLNTPGDSYTAGNSDCLIDSSLCAYPKYLTQQHWFKLNNIAFGGTVVSDTNQEYKITALNINDTSTSSYLTGINDERLGQTRNDFTQALSGAIAKMGYPDSLKTYYLDTSIHYYGTWSNGNPVNKNSNVLNDSAVFNAKGTSIVLGTYSIVGQGSFQVFIDNVNKGSISCSRDNNNPGGRDRAYAAYVFPSLSNTLHHVRLVVNQSGKSAFLQYYYGNLGVIRQHPRLPVTGVIPIPIAGYATWGGSPASVAAYTSWIDSLVLLYKSVNTGIQHVHVYLDTTVGSPYFLADNLHPTPLGAQHISDTIADSLFPSNLKKTLKDLERYLPFALSQLQSAGSPSTVVQKIVSTENVNGRNGGVFSLNPATTSGAFSHITVGRDSSGNQYDINYLSPNFPYSGHGLGPNSAYNFCAFCSGGMNFDDFYSTGIGSPIAFYHGTYADLWMSGQRTISIGDTNFYSGVKLNVTGNITSSTTETGRNGGIWSLNQSTGASAFSHISVGRDSTGNNWDFNYTSPNFTYSGFGLGPNSAVSVCGACSGGMNFRNLYSTGTGSPIGFYHSAWPDMWISGQQTISIGDTVYHSSDRLYVNGNVANAGTDSVSGFRGTGLANSASKQIANDSSEMVEVGNYTVLYKSINGVPSLAYYRVGGTPGSQTPVTNGQTIFSFQVCSDTVTNGLPICNNFIRAIPKGTWSGSNKGQIISLTTIDSGTTVTRLTQIINGDLQIPRHYLTSDSIPALSSCGTSPAITTGSSDVAGEITEGTIATGCTITFQTAFKQTPFCTITEQSGLSASYTTSNSAITITNIGALSSTKLNYMCIGN